MIYEVAPIAQGGTQPNYCCGGNGAAPALGRALTWISSSGCGYKVKWTLRSHCLQPLSPASHFYLPWKTLIYLLFKCHKEKLSPWGSKPGALVTPSWIPMVGFTGKGSPKAFQSPSMSVFPLNQDYCGELCN